MRDLPPRAGQPPLAPGERPAVARPELVGEQPAAQRAGAQPPAAPTAARTRLDTELVRRGLARSRTHAGRLVADGRVSIDGRTASRPAQALTADADVVVADSAADFASRAGGKLDGALDAFAADPATGGQVAVAGRRCLDAGASTGGFTDVLLRRGAVSVIAVDVGTEQLRPELVADERVDVRENTDIRDVSVADLADGPVDLAVADLSFISLTKVLPALGALVRPDGDLVLLVKPQFEVGREAVGRGVVADPALWRQAVASVTSAAAEQGWAVVSEVPSSVPGRAGNREFVLWLRRSPVPSVEGGQR